jgi:streptogramin lyase
MVTMAAPGDAMVDAVGFGPIVDLAQDAKGRLWVVTAKEGLVGAFSPDFPLDRPPLAGRMFGFPTGTDEYRFIQESDVCAIEPDKAGDVWAVTNRFAVLRFPVQAQHWHWEVVQEGLALPPAQAMQMGPVKEKGFLVLARSGDLSSLRYFDRETDTWESWQTPSAQGFAVAPNGTVYFAAGVEGLFSLANGQLNKPAINEELAQDDHYQPDRTKPDMTTVIPVNLVFCDSQGNLWIANGHYLWKFQP